MTLRTVLGRLQVVHSEGGWAVPALCGSKPAITWSDSKGWHLNTTDDAADVTCSVCLDLMAAKAGEVEA